MIAPLVLTVVATLGFTLVAILAKRVEHRGGLSIDPYEASTAQLEVVYPFQASGGPGRRGLLVGASRLGGEPYFYCPWELYATRPGFTNTNMVVAGQIGRGKSSLVKSYVWRQIALGRKAYIVDPKGEFGPLAEACGGSHIRLEPGGPVTVNPVAGPNRAQAKRSLLAVVAAALGRALTEWERAGLQVALDQADTTNGGQPTLSDVLRALNHPEPGSAAELNTTPEDLAHHTKKATLAVWEMCHGTLAGMVDGPTTAEVDWDAPVVVVDISALEGDSEGLAIAMAATMAWLDPILTQENAGQKILLLDEAWRLLTSIELARYLRARFKLSRQHGLQNIIVIHRMSDLEAAGGEGSEATRIAQGLLSDTETRVVYAQSQGELADTQRLLALTNTETGLLPKLGLGTALWKVGSHSAVVQHLMTPRELRITYSDASQEARHGTGPRVADLEKMAG